MKTPLIFFGILTLLCITAVICGATHYTMPGFIAGCVTLAAYLELQEEKEQKNHNKHASHE